MTDDDHALIARALKTARHHPDDGLLVDQECCNLNARAVADALKRDNPHFDRAKFLRAAGFRS